MTWFKKIPPEPINYNDPFLDDDSWLRSGESRYATLVKDHYGSPDTIAAGGRQCGQNGDIAASLFFFQKAIDTLHSNYVTVFGDGGPASWRRQPSSLDFGIVDDYLRTLSEVREMRPGAPIGSSVVEVTHRLRTISSRFKRHRLDQSPYLDRLNTLQQIAPDIDVDDVFWD